MTTPKHVKERVKLNPKLNPNGKGGGSVTHYQKKYCEMLIEHMSKGFSFSSFGADINTCAKTLNNWVNEYPEFGMARRIGHEKAKKYIESIANMKMRGVENAKFSAKKSDTALIIFFLKTRFRDEYSERFEVDHTSAGKSITLKYELNRIKKEEDEKES